LSKLLKYVWGDGGSMCTHAYKWTESAIGRMHPFLYTTENVCAELI